MSTGTEPFFISILSGGHGQGTGVGSVVRIMVSVYPGPKARNLGFILVLHYQI